MHPDLLRSSDAYFRTSFSADAHDTAQFTLEVHGIVAAVDESGAEHAFIIASRDLREQLHRLLDLHVASVGEPGNDEGE